MSNKRGRTKRRADKKLTMMTTTMMVTSATREPSMTMTLTSHTKIMSWNPGLTKTIATKSQTKLTWWLGLTTKCTKQMTRTTTDNKWQQHHHPWQWRWRRAKHNAVLETRTRNNGYQKNTGLWWELQEKEAVLESRTDNNNRNRNT